MDEYLPISEFAKLAGVSHQTVYKQLQNKLRNYVQLVAGKKMLSVKALRDVYGIGVAENGCATILTGTQEKTSDNMAMDAMFITISALKAQLEAKDIQLQSKDNQLASKDKQIEELTTTIRIQAESISADRKNELAGTLLDGHNALIPHDDEKKKRRGLFGWLSRGQDL